jgi:HTH-type transcriptional regulator, transcriptional repressor of NAD biosynthesis genes
MTMFVDAFAPPLVAQHRVIESALDSEPTGSVDLVVRSTSPCPLPLRTRMNLLRRIHPDATVVSMEGGLDDTRAISFPEEAKAARLDPVGAWSHFHPFTKAELTIRVCCIGAESTGKSTLVQALAAKHNTNQIHEFGRDYTVKKLADGTNDHWTTDDFIEIAQMQQELEDEAAVDSGPLMFCDTDAMTTALWHERYLKIRSREVEEYGRTRTYDLFVLCDTDIPWERDGVRLGADTRASMHRRFLDVLKTERREPWVLASGSVERRIATVEAMIDQLGLLTPAAMYAPARFANR